MTQRPDDTNPMDPFGMMKGMRDANMEAWSKVMQQFVNTEAYSQASGAMLDAYLTTSAPFRKLLEQTMTQVLTQFNMPTRKDVTSLAERLTNIEMRLDDFDAQLTALSQASSHPHPSGTSQHAEPTETDIQPTAEAASMDPVVDTISETGNKEQPTPPSSSSRRGSKSKEGQ